MFELLQGCNLEELAVMRQEVMSHDHTLPEVTQNGRDFTGSQPEVAVEGRKFEFWVCLSSFSAVTRRR